MKNVRLHAARLAGGFFQLTKAAVALGVNEATYRAAESGRRAPSSRLLSVAASTFGVSLEFLRDNATLSEQDKLAGRIVDALEFHLAGNGSSLLVAGENLRNARKRAGYASASSAAASWGFRASTLSQHESGMRAITVDAATGYALALGVELRSFIVSAEDDFRPPKRSKEWKWLLRMASTPNRTIPILSLDGDGAVRLSNERLPKVLTPPGASYAFFPQLPARHDIYILRRWQGDASARRQMLAWDGTRVSMDSGFGDCADPVGEKGTLNHPLVIGECIGTLEFRPPLPLTRPLATAETLGRPVRSETQTSLQVRKSA